MAYKIIRGGSDTEVATKVETAQQEGWQCQGGVSVSYDSNDDAYFAQAMVRPTINIHKGSVDDDQWFIQAPQRPVYKVGDRVRVIDNTSEHGFNLNEEVEVEEIDQYGFISCQREDILTLRSWMSSKDVEPLSKAPYQVGDIVRIARNTTAHEFEVGEMVEVVTVYYDRPRPFVVATDGNKQWNVHLEDITLVRRRPAKSKAP